MEQIAFNTRGKAEEYMLIVMDKSIDEVHYKIIKKTLYSSFYFLEWCIGIFNFTNSKEKFCLAKSYINKDGFI